MPGCQLKCSFRPRDRPRPGPGPFSRDLEGQPECLDYARANSDTMGHRRAVLGQLPNGDHAIELTDTSGHSRELLPTLDDYVGTTLVTLRGSSTVTIDVAANCRLMSHACEITAGAFVGYPTAANAYLVIDGNPARASPA